MNFPNFLNWDFEIVKTLSFFEIWPWVFAKKKEGMSCSKIVSFLLWVFFIFAQKKPVDSDKTSLFQEEEYDCSALVLCPLGWRPDSRTGLQEISEMTYGTPLRVQTRCLMEWSRLYDWYLMIDHLDYPFYVRSQTSVDWHDFVQCWPKARRWKLNHKWDPWSGHLNIITPGTPAQPNIKWFTRRLIIYYSVS